MTTEDLIPTEDPYYYLTEDVKVLFNRLNKYVEQGKTTRSLLTGPHGSGKTSLAQQFAAIHKMPLLIMDCANLREPRDWFGYKTIDEGKMRWHESLFSLVLARGNHVILLDEINRAHPLVLNTLMPLLDNRGFSYLEEKGSNIQVGPGTVFFATMNEGMQYTGTLACDVALKDRFNRVVEIDYLETDNETNILVSKTGISKENAKRLVDIANVIRNRSTGLGSTFTQGFSTRQLIAVAEDFTVDGPQSLTFTLVNRFSGAGGSESERSAVLQLIQGKFNV